jgi:hypothetical protein
VELVDDHDQPWGNPDLRDKIRVFVLPERRSEWVGPRAVKLKMSNSPASARQGITPRRGLARRD